jgi:hypothetical protein
MSPPHVPLGLLLVWHKLDFETASRNLSQLITASRSPNERPMRMAGFLCPLSANTYGIDFLHFKIRDYVGGRILFEVKKDQACPPARQVRYHSDSESRPNVA